MLGTVMTVAHFIRFLLHFLVQLKSFCFFGKKRTELGVFKMCKFFKSYEESLHQGVCKLAKYVRNCVVFWKNLHSWQKFYTTAGRDGRDKFQVCPVPSCINQYRLLLTQYHQVPNSTAFCWTSTITYQPVPLHNDPEPTSINQYRPILTQYHQVPTSTASYRPITTKHQPLPPSTDPVPSYINQYRFILTQYHQVSTSTNLYCFCLGTTDSCTVYPGSCSN